MTVPAPGLAEPVTALVLAGGRGSRMGGVDKGLVPLQGAPLVQQALQRLRMQLGGGPAEIAINANRQLADYAAFGLPVWPDPVPGFVGPLAGFAAGLEHCRTPLLLTVPCDVPRFPLDLLRRLRQALLQEQADLALAAAPDEGGVTRWQPVFCLLRVGLRQSLLDYLEMGECKVQKWARLHCCAVVPFNTPTDDPLAFRNLNTPEQLRALEADLARAD
ncbi:MAG: molybdopterin-guanine dinucleotide biosynthesis protein A [Comamonadaceae bacterium BICA1-1]|nr:MAG: molybdopterin-guanine dinucleotide biosynthesis protein A [Comamonadaceae bacterium BICA1-1]